MPRDAARAVFGREISDICQARAAGTGQINKLPRLDLLVGGSAYSYKGSRPSSPTLRYASMDRAASGVVDRMADLPECPCRSAPWKRRETSPEFTEAQPPLRIRIRSSNVFFEFAFQGVQSVIHHLAEREFAFPPQPLDGPLRAQRPSVRAGQSEPPVGMNHVIFVQERDLIATNIDQPPVMRQASLIGSLDAERRFLRSGGHLDVASFADANHLSADPERVANVLQCMGADHEVELLVGKRPGRPVAHVPLDPCVLGEPFLVAILRRLSPKVR